MPKPAAPTTVATPGTPVAARAIPDRRLWRTHGVATAVAVAALIALAAVWVRGSASTTQGAASAPIPPRPAAASAAEVLPSVPSVAAAPEFRGAPSEVGVAPAAHVVRHDSAARPTATVAAQGIVALAVAPWGSVYVNGDARGTTPPLTQLMLPAGRYTIEIRNGEQAPYVAQVDVTPERPQQIHHRFQ
jgi:hypothetical protein